MDHCRQDQAAKSGWQTIFQDKIDSSNINEVFKGVDSPKLRWQKHLFKQNRVGLPKIESESSIAKKIEKFLIVCKVDLNIKRTKKGSGSNESNAKLTWIVKINCNKAKLTHSQVARGHQING